MEAFALLRNRIRLPKSRFLSPEGSAASDEYARKADLILR
jgi:hypothetical protein